MLASRDVLLNVMSRHIGRGHGIGVCDLALQLDVPERQVRSLITELRHDGVAICGTPKDGYYIAKDADELEETCNFLRRRALHSLSLESCLRKMPLADLVGQLHLRT